MTDDPELARRAAACRRARPRCGRGRGRLPRPLRAFHALTGYVATGDWDRRALLTVSRGVPLVVLAGRTTPDWDAATAIAELETLDTVLRARCARAEVYATRRCITPRFCPSIGRGRPVCLPVRLDGWAVKTILDFASKQGIFSSDRLPGHPPGVRGAAANAPRRGVGAGR